MEFLNFEGLAYFKEKENSQFAPVESTTTASQAYEIGQYFWYEGKLYEATAAIALGDTFVTSGDSANCELADIADDISDARERISTLEGQVTDLETNKANIDGYYSEMTVGNAEQLVSTVGIEDKTPYNFRTAGGSVDIGDREEDMIVGGTVAWNQLVTTDTNVSKTKSGDIITVNDAVAGNAEDLIVSFEPQQDLHGYDYPWPEGGSTNKLSPYTGTNKSRTGNGLTCVANDDGTYTFSNATSGGTFDTSFDVKGYVIQEGDYIHFFNTVTSSSAQCLLIFTDNTYQSTTFSTENKITSLSSHVGKTTKAVRFYVASGITINDTIKPMIVASSSATTWKPYANICPITGWTGCDAKVSNENLIDVETQSFSGKMQIRYAVIADIELYPDPSGGKTSGIGKGIGDIGSVVIKERKFMSNDGILVTIINIDPIKKEEFKN